MSRWFRHYAGLARDEKLVRVALRAKQPVERVVWIWAAILESAAEVNDGGKFDVDAAEVARFLGADEGDICAVFDGLSAAGRLADCAVVKWGCRQFESDRSASRQAAYRERKKGGDGAADGKEASGKRHVTAVSRHGDAPETETETETETDKKVYRPVAKATRPTNAAFEEFWKAYPKRKGENPKEPARKQFEALVRQGVDPQTIIRGVKAAAERHRDKIGTEFIPQAVKWLRDKRWEEYETTGPPIAMRLLQPGSEEWKAEREAKVARGESTALMDTQAERGVGWAVTENEAA